MKQNKLLTILLLAGLLGAGLSSPSAWAAKKAEASEYMTKGDAIQLLSATDFVKKKIGELLSWTIGYDISKVSRVRLTPTINYVKVVPRQSPPDGRTILDLLASVDDPGGLSNISGVRADLSSIGRLPNTMLVDNGLFGDKKAGDGIFSLQTTVSTRVTQGTKDIPVAVANKKGWLALAKTSVDIHKNPNIIDIQVSPDKVPADDKSLVTISVRIDNPGRLEDVRGVTANLKSLGLGETTNLKNDNLGKNPLAGGDTWTASFYLSRGTEAGTYNIPIQVGNLAGGSASSQIAITVIK